MTLPIADYRYSDLTEAMKSLEIARGDVVIMHSNIANFGVPEGSLDRQQICERAVQAVQDAIGEDGTLVMPAFSYSFGQDKAEKIFDVTSTPSVCGVLTEYLRNLANARRSREPMLSVVAIGAQAGELTKNISNVCLGAGSVWERLHAAKAKICNLNLDPGSTFIHYFERLMNVPYRSDIRMDGFCVDDGERIPHHVVYAGRDLDNAAHANCRDRYFEMAYARGSARRCNVGRGFIASMSLDDTANLLERELRADPWLLTAAGQKKPSRSFA